MPYKDKNKQLEWERRRYWKNRDKVLRQHKEYWQRNKEKISQRQKEYRKKNKEKYRLYINKYTREKRKTDLRFRLFGDISSGVYKSLKKKKAGRKWEKLLGYTIDDLIPHLEKQFTPKMCWANYGSYWEIDHIKAKSLFDKSEIKESWSLSNLQPLEKTANRKKYNKFIL